MKFLADFFAFRKQRKEERDDKAERAAIAKAFNDRYCYRMPYQPKEARDSDDQNLRRSGGSGAAMVKRQHHSGLSDWFMDRAWMCPKCNAVHFTIGKSWISGMWFPGCCDHPEGHRCHDKIRTQA